MAYPAKFDNQADPYGHLLQRLASALDEASNLDHLSDEPATEMEVRGLSATELALITAYLANDYDWLRGWHITGAAPEEHLSPPFERHAGVVIGCAAGTAPRGAQLVADD